MTKEYPEWPTRGRVAVDLETCDPQLHKLGPGVRRGGYVIGVAYAIEDGPAAYLPVAHADGNLDPTHVWAYLRDQARTFRGEVVGANLQYDLDYLWEEGVEFHDDVTYRDVQVAEPLLDELQFSYSLENIAQRHGLEGKDESGLREAVEELPLNIRKLKNDRHVKENLWRLHASRVERYAIQDVRLPLRLLRIQEQELARQGLSNVWDLESRVLPILVRMRRRGVAIDQRRLEEIQSWAEGVESEELRRVKYLTGVEVEPWKPTLVARALGEVGIECGRTPTGKQSVTQDWLASLDHDVPRAVLRARQMSKLRGTFCKQVREQLTWGRVHCTFNQLRTQRDDGSLFGAAYGRLSSTNFNIQNQPIRNEEYGRRWRSIFVPDEGREWASLDFSAQEPRMIVHYAHELGLRGVGRFVRGFREDTNFDTHQMTADMMGLSRRDAKETFLGLAYKMGGGKLCEKLGLPYDWKEVDFGDGPRRIRVAGEEGEKILCEFNATFPFLKAFAWECVGKAEERGYVFTLSGRRCRFRERKGGGLIDVHKAPNRVIQGSSADQMKEALVALDETGVPMQLTVHDEVCFSARNELEARDTARIMEEALELSVPSRCDVKLGKNWGECK